MARHLVQSGKGLAVAGTMRPATDGSAVGSMNDAPNFVGARDPPVVSFAKATSAMHTSGSHQGWLSGSYRRSAPKTWCRTCCAPAHTTLMGGDTRDLLTTLRASPRCHVRPRYVCAAEEGRFTLPKQIAEEQTACLFASICVVADA